MHVLQSCFDLFEEVLVAGLEFSACFADIEMMHLPIEDILKAFAGVRQIQFLYHIQSFQKLEISIEARAIDVGNLLGEILLYIFQGELLGLIIEDKLDQ